MTVYQYQRTLAALVHFEGVGVHSGKTAHLTIKPAPVNHGIKFVRTDLPGQLAVTGHFNRVVDTSLATVLGDEGCIVSTVEHVMATLSGLAIDNALIEVDTYELPILDGSAGPFTRAIRKAGIVTQKGPRCYFVVTTPIEIKANGKKVGIYPADQYRISCTIDYNHPLIGEQTYSLDITAERFETEISTARTFGFLHEVEYLKKYGLGQGASLENAVVIDGEGLLNEEGLRFADEFVRHKILDCIGDFSLLGMPIIGHVVAYKSGHAFNHAFLETFFTRKDAWETRTLVNADTEAADSSESPLIAV
jgi:UDP-3-O-[3-hydroxymyristoyl] N-acetylglucosamine deacetylase